MPEWKTIPPDHPALPGHFTGNPIVPGVVLLSQVWDAVCAQADQPLQCTAWPNVKFLAPLFPGVPFCVELEMGETPSAKFVCKTASHVIAQGNVKFSVKAVS